MDQLPFERGDDPLVAAEHYRTVQDRSAVAPVRTMAGDAAWLVTRYADVKALLSDERLGRSHPRPEQAARISPSALLGGAAGDHENEERQHQRLRRLLAPAFSARRMGQLQTRIGELVDGLLDEMRTPPADLHLAVSVPLPVMVICELLGVPYGEDDRLRTWSTDLASLDADRSQAALRDFTGYLHTLIEHKRGNPGDDVISDLVRAEAAMTDTDVARVAATLLFAGHETTTVRIDLGTLLLISHPDQYRALRADPRLIDSAVDEVLRMSTFSSIGGLPRYANTDLSIDDVTVAAGDAVLLSIAAANRDLRAFAEPDTFDITRTPNKHLAFGHGPRYCIGASLARVELCEVLRRIVDRFPRLDLAVPREELRTHRKSLTGGLVSLPVTW
ncbi:cytochrome P450 [Amycolatopsis benzoatilytica]|uniref:cytochrome P450 n=1 Tax=Amycolatopsis benzoatilytica TaxID=346045 RepID=UPI00037FCD7C|nr:cytochrome P450 [Amycolatopsis benzoatilytica]